MCYSHVCGMLAICMCTFCLKSAVHPLCAHFQFRFLLFESRESAGRIPDASKYRSFPCMVRSASFSRACSVYHCIYHVDPCGGHGEIFTLVFISMTSGAHHVHRSATIKTTVSTIGRHIQTQEKRRGRPRIHGTSRIFIVHPK